MALPKITFTGNLVVDPETRTTNSGTNVTSFRVASNKKGRDGREDQTTFLTVTVWKELGDNVAAEFTKGERITIAGDLTQREWESDGQKRTAYEVTAWEVSRPVSSFADNGGSRGGNFQQKPAGDPFGGADSAPF